MKKMVLSFEFLVLRYHGTKMLTDENLNTLSRAEITEFAEKYELIVVLIKRNRLSRQTPCT